MSLAKMKLIVVSVLSKLTLLLFEKKPFADTDDTVVKSTIIYGRKLRILRDVLIAVSPSENGRSY